MNTAVDRGRGAMTPIGLPRASSHGALVRADPTNRANGKPAASRFVVHLSLSGKARWLGARGRW